MVRWLAGMTVVVVAALASAGGGATRVTHVTLRRALYSRAVDGRLQLAVYLPADYPTSGKRYPAIYFLHGLPAGPTAYQGSSFLADALDRTGREAVIVAPQGARDSDSDPEYLDWGTGRNWETAITHDVVRYVDAHFRTIADRRGRAIVGLSAGGYGAVLLALHHLPSFSVIESWSGYFHPTNPAGTAALDLGSRSANARASAHTFVVTLRRSFARQPTFFAFYVGRGDERFRAENVQLDRELDRARVGHVFRVYPGGHQQSIWQRHAATWLNLAAAHLAPPRR
ncbi:MAG TPA: alpha/beta hydrolase-fold protein [Gaiellaceae bacterium]|nr:alpha/beta hydrolase-fold protein [Gaiellaceae bacterium]